MPSRENSRATLSALPGRPRPTIPTSGQRAALLPRATLEPSLLVISDVPDLGPHQHAKHLFHEINDPLPAAKAFDQRNNRSCRWTPRFRIALKDARLGQPK